MTFFTKKKTNKYTPTRGDTYFGNYEGGKKVSIVKNHHVNDTASRKSMCVLKTLMPPSNNAVAFSSIQLAKLRTQHTVVINLY